MSRYCDICGAAYPKDERDQRIAKLEAEVVDIESERENLFSLFVLHCEAEEAAEAKLRAVGELRDQWKKYGMEKHWIEWDNSTIFNKCADELEALLK